MEKRQIFRKESLEKLSSPERLDQLLRVVRPQGWITLMSLGVGIVLAIVWSILGHVPVTANGTAILVHPKRVVPFQAPASGHLNQLLVSVGDEVAKNDVLGYLHLPDLEKELEEEEDKLEQFDKRRVELGKMEKKQAEAELDAIGKKTSLLEQRIEDIREQAEKRKLRSDEWIESQRTNLETSEALSRTLAKELQERLDSKERLLHTKDIAQDQVVEARSRKIENDLALAQLAVKREELSLREELTQQDFDDQIDLVRDLELQITDLELRRTEIDHRIKTLTIDLEYEQDRIHSNIELLLARLKNEQEIRSPYTGTVIEITVAAGEEVTVGRRLGKIEMPLENDKLMALAFFPVKDGKKIELQDKIQVSPATVQRERYGGIIGWVEDVSRYPVTVEAAANLIGDMELARGLLGGEARIQVIARLTEDSDDPTKFIWTSGAHPKDVVVTAGTTAGVRVTIEERRPITLVLPFLESLSGN